MYCRSREALIMKCIARIVGVLITLSLLALSQQIDAECDKYYEPVKKVSPEYPRRAQSRGIEGFVELEYNVTTDGKVDDVRVLDASPKGVFDRVAMIAVQHFEFRPCSDQGRFVEIRNIPQRFSFAVSGK
jgi:protein TonB